MEEEEEGVASRRRHSSREYTPSPDESAVGVLNETRSLVQRWEWTTYRDGSMWIKVISI